LKILQQLSSSDIIDTLLFQVNPNFLSSKIQNTIEKIRFEIAQKLMQLILKEEKLLDHLQLLKQYYFVDKGEFYQIFIEESRNIMKLPPNANTEYDINGIAYQNVKFSW
jgi:gamma-tubulin complex component 4